MRDPLRSALVLLCAVGLTAGCAEPIAREWISPDRLSYYENGTVYAPNRMTIGSDGTGKADIHYVLTADPTQQENLDRFEIEWEEEGDAVYRLEMACWSSEIMPAPCDSRDFVMVCEEGDDKDYECTGDGDWAGYEFIWERHASD